MDGARGWGARAGIGTAAVLLATCLAGTPLYVSSSASEAIQQQLAQTCASDSALVLAIPPPVPGQESVSAEDVEAFASVVPHVDRAITTITASTTVGTAAGNKRLTLIARDGAAGEVSPPLAPLAVNEVAMPDIALTSLGLEFGDRIVAGAAGGAPIELLVAQRFDSLPFQPEPSYWCGFRPFLRPTPAGDPPPAWGIVAPETQLSFGGPFSTTLEYRVSRQPLTMFEATQTNTGYDAAISDYAAAAGGFAAQPPQLPTLLGRATSLSTAVAKSIDVVRLAGVVAAVVVMVAGGVMLAQERRRELRLLALRGVSPSRSAARLLPAVAAPIAVGSLAGFWLAFVAVRVLGPTPEVERAAVVEAAVAVTVAAVLAVLLVAGSAALVGDRFVDARPHRRRWTSLPVEIVVIAVAVLSFRRLDDVGGLRMFGVQSRGGELLAQAFPLFGLVAVVAALARLMRWLVRRARLAGRRLPAALRLGVRRAVLQPGLTVALLAAVALASGCFTVSTVLAASARQQLDDKASVYLGADVVVNVFDDIDLPPALVGKATMVVRLDGRVDGTSLELLGVDPVTFLDAARMRADGADASLDQLMDAITFTGGADDPLPAVLVGARRFEGPVVFETVHGRALAPIVQVATAEFFPGFQTSDLAIVDRDALVEHSAGYRRAVWVRDAPADVIDVLRDAGIRIGAVQRVGDVFDSSSYSAQRWSYAPLAALGALFAVVVLTMQLLVIEARRDSRRMSHVMMQRMGFSTRSLWVSAVVEVGIPLAVGALIGVAGGLGSSGLSLTRLDPLPNLQPPSRLVAPPGPFLGLAVSIVLATLLLAALTVRSATSGTTMEVMRGTA